MDVGAHIPIILHDKDWESWGSQGSLQFSQRLSWSTDRIAQTFGRLRQGGLRIPGWIHTRTLSPKTKLPGEEAHICNSNVPNAEAGGWPYTWGKLELYKETLSQEVGAEIRGTKNNCYSFLKPNSSSEVLENVSLSAYLYWMEVLGGLVIVWNYYCQDLSHSTHVLYPWGMLPAHESTKSVRTSYMNFIWILLS